MCSRSEIELLFSPTEANRRSIASPSLSSSMFQIAAKSVSVGVVRSIAWNELPLLLMPDTNMSNDHSVAASVLFLHSPVMLPLVSEVGTPIGSIHLASVPSAHPYRSFASSYSPVVTFSIRTYMACPPVIDAPPFDWKPSFSGQHSTGCTSFARMYRSRADSSGLLPASSRRMIPLGSIFVSLLFPERSRFGGQEGTSPDNRMYSLENVASSWSDH